ncbi:MAG TPA: SulP family inorganic anion transporter, partial [Polyangiaceae bacterium]|nr:SulP family inorganic anion transporter [Polyangiaceae bacterium]
MADAAAAEARAGAARALNLRSIFADVRAGSIVFLVALPLCLGIAAGSGAPPLSGLIAGIVGGTVVALLSGSPLSVAGPAAGLTVVVFDGIEALGFRSFLLAVTLSGLLQIALAAIGAGRLAQLVPNAVIRGMLAAIGLILALKQLPHAVGYDADPEGDFAFRQADGHNTFSELLYSLRAFDLGPLIVSAAAALGLWLWRDYPRAPLQRYVPRELAAVCAGLAGAAFLEGTTFALAPEHRVSIPLLGEEGLGALWTAPSVAGLGQLAVWKTALTLAIVASIESLLCVEATDRLDPQRRTSPMNRELWAQGVGNATAGALGGLPVTAVVVRSFSNVQAGGRTRLAALTHGALLLLATLLFAPLINDIPLAALAVVLLRVGYKLTPPSLYRELWRMGRAQFLPFVSTVLAILLTDLLTGTLLGLGFAIFFFVWAHYRSAIV